jgi:uncharacterized membrane protein YkvA (DUF1232 family)
MEALQVNQQDSPSDRSPRAWSALVKNVRLAWRLLRDPMVPAWTKLIPLGAVLYVLLPTDLIPDVLFGFGQLDDLGVLLLALRMFISMSPAQVVQRHLAAMSAVDGSYRVVDEEPPRPSTAGYLEDGAQIPTDEATPSTVEGTAKRMDENP